MFGLDSGELIVIGVVALIVIGPKDLPDLFRTIGQLTGKARGMAREFSRAMDQAANQSGVSDLSKSIKAATDPAKFGLDTLRDAAKPSAKPVEKTGPATQALSAERAEFKAKMDAKAAEIRAAKAAAIEASDLEREADVTEHAEDLSVPDTATTAPAPKPRPSRAAPRTSAARAAKPAADAPAAKPRTRKAAKPEAAK